MTKLIHHRRQDDHTLGIPSAWCRRSQRQAVQALPSLEQPERHRRREAQAHAADCRKRHPGVHSLSAVPRCQGTGGSVLRATFYAVQALELVAGATNVVLLGLNIRDDFRLSGRFIRPSGPHDVQLIGRDLVTDRTMAFRLAKPSGFQHQAGQSVSLELPNSSETDAKGAPAP